VYGNHQRHFNWELPNIDMLAAALAALDATYVDMEDGWF